MQNIFLKIEIDEKKIFNFRTYKDNRTHEPSKNQGFIDRRNLFGAESSGTFTYHSDGQHFKVFRKQKLLAMQRSYLKKNVFLGPINFGTRF